MTSPFFSLRNTTAFITLSLLIPCLALAQQKVGSSTHADAYASKIMSRKPGETLDRFLGVENGQYKLRIEGSGRKEVVSYSKELVEMGRETAQVIEVEQDKAEKAERIFLDFAGKSWLLKGTTDRDSKTNAFSLTALNENGDQLGSKDLGQIVGPEFYFVVENANLNYTMSTDGSKLLVYYQLPLTKDEKREKMIRYRFLALDSAANIIWQIDHGAKDSDHRDRSFQHIKIGGDGTAFFYVITARAKDKGSRGADLFCIRDGKVTSSTISNEVITSATSWLDSKGYHVVYTLGSRAENFMGLGKSNKTSGIVAISWTGEQGKGRKKVDLPFTPEHAIKNQPKRDFRKYKKANKKGQIWIPYAKINDRAALPGGGQIIFVAEDYAISRTSKSGMTTTTYYSKDIHLFAFDEDLNLQWSTIVPLYQISKDNSSLGFVQTVVDDNLHILFNDHKENFDKWYPGKTLTRYGGGTAPVGHVTINLSNPEAKQKREKLWISSAVGGNMFPYMFHRINDEPSALLYVQGGKLKYSLVRIDFK